VELQLGFAPTPIEVPNLTVPEPDLPSDPDSADSTRIRQVTTISPHQPVAVRPAPAAGPEPTMLRGPRMIAPEGLRPVSPESTMLRPRVQPAVPGTPTSAEPPKRRRGGLIAGIATAAVLAVVATIVIVNIVGTPPEDAAEPLDPTGTALAPPDYPPTPVAVGTPSVGADGTSIVFTWENPDPQDEDEFVWQRTDGAHAGDGRFDTSETNTVVADVAPGSVVCISVWVARDGELSVEPLNLCSS
jgi:hypothetical protein